MKLPTLIMAGLTCACLCVASGEEWPAEARAYEQLAAHEPQVGAAFERLWNFASGVGQLDALKARWEAASRGDGAWNWSVLAGLLAERRGEIEEARNHLRHATEMAPARFAPWLALGEFEARRGTPDAGAAFEKAIPLAASLAEQVRAVAALAAWHRAAGRPDQARAAIEPRFEAARDPDLRLALTPALVEVCFAEGTLSALTERFEERQRSGDWRFGIYLAEIDAVAQDYVAARKRLEELLAEHPDDLLVIQQAATIARREKRPVNLAWLLRFRAERFHDRRAWRDLFVAMLEAGHPAECARLLEEHAPEIGAQPSFWRMQLPRLWQFDLLEPARRAVESQVENGGWECRLALAELLIAAGREREAAPHLWTVIEATAPAITAQALEIGNSLESPLSKSLPSFPGQTPASRIQGMKLLQKDFSQVANPSSDLAAPFDVAVETLQDAREEALLHLALLAQHTGEETQFLERLPHALRDWPGGERVLAWAAIEHAPGLLREIAAYAAGPDRQPEADRFCAAQLAKLSTQAALEAPPEELARLRDIFSPKEAAAPRDAGRPGWYVAFQKCFDAFIECDFERAGRCFEEGVAARPPPDQLDAFKMSLAHGIRGLRDNQKTAEAAAFAMACIYPRELPSATLAQPLEFFRVLPHSEPHFTFNLMFDVAGPDHYFMQSEFFTPPRLWINQSLNTAMWMVFDNVGENRRAEVLELLERQPRELPGARGQFARLGAAYFAWWMDRKDVTEMQLRALLAEVPRDELRIALGGLLTDTNRHGEALAILQEIKPARRGERRKLETWCARIAAAGWKQPVPDDDEDAVEKPPWIRAGDISSPFSKEDAHETIAIPPAAARRWTSLQTGRDLAWRMIDNADERAAVVAALRAQIAGAGSLNAWERVAEAETEPSQVAAACEKIFALDPGNLLAVRLLARDFAENGGGAKAVLSHAEAAIEHRLAEGVPAPDDEIWRLFEKADALPRLAAAIDRAAPDFLARGSSATVNRLDNIGEKLRAMALDDGAIRVWRKALSLSGSDDGKKAAIRRKLAAILARSKDRATAIGSIADLLLPQGPTHVLFAISPAPDAEPVVSIIALIKTAIRFGGLAELRQRGEAAAAHDTGARRILALIRVLGRDPGVLPELSAAATTFRNEPGAAPLLLSLAEELADWPEAHAVCLELVAAHARMSPEPPGEERLRMAKVAARAGGTEVALKIARDVLEATPPGSNQAQRTLPMIGEVAIAAHAPALVGECGRRWLEQNSRSRISDLADAFKLAGLLIDAGCAEEQRQMIAALRANDVVRRESFWQNRLRIFDLEAGLKRGDVRQVSPIVWLNPDRSAGEQAALVWDVGAMFGPDDARQPVTTGAPLPKMDGRFTIELFFGEDAGDMRTLARLPQAQARGVWRGVLPAPEGLVRAVLWDGDRAVFADPLPVFLGPDLLRAEAGGDPAWGITQDSVTRVKGGPAVGGEYFSFRPVEPDGPDEPIVGRRVKLTPGRDCILSGWIRADGDRHVRIGWRCLDDSGAVLTSGETPNVITSGRIWSYCLIRLAWPQNDRGSARLPDKARYLEPMIAGGSAGFDLASLSLVEVPETEPQETP